MCPERKYKATGKCQKRDQKTEVLSSHAHGELWRKPAHESSPSAWKGGSGESREGRLPPHQWKIRAERKLRHSRPDIPSSVWRGLGLSAPVNRVLCVLRTAVGLVPFNWQSPVIY